LRFNNTPTNVDGKPLSLVLIVIYTVIVGILGVIAGVLGLVAGELVSIDVAITSILLLPVGVLLLAAAYGLWTKQKWGLTLARGIYLVSLVLDIASVLISGISTTSELFSVVEIILEILVIIYLFRPETQALFQ